MNTVKKYEGTSFVTANGVGLYVNAEKIQYKFMSHRTHFRTKLLRDNYLKSYLKVWQNSNIWE